MSTTETQPPRRTRPAPIDVEVESVERQPGGVVRVSFTGEALAGFAWPGAASHLKFFLPMADDSSGGSRDPDSPAPRPLSRTYTPRAYDAAKQLLAIDFLLHGEGPAARWASSARPGDQAQMSAPRASYRPDPDARWMILAGDDSAVPAIGTILDAGFVLPTQVLIETLSPETDRPVLPSAPRVSIRFVEASPKCPGSRLEAAMRETELPSGAGAIWVACEAVAVRQIRALLIGEREVLQNALVTRGYWRQGEANHPDHDFGVDE